MSRIYYYCSANRTPTGGNKVTYRHVAILNQLGFDACVLHPKSGFRYASFDHQPPVLGLDQLRLRPDDLLVMPEDGGPGMCRFAPGVHKLMFNQGAYNTFRGFVVDDRFALFPARHKQKAIAFMTRKNPAGCRAGAPDPAVPRRFADRALEDGASHVRRTCTAEAERQDLRRFYASLLADG